MLLVKPQAQHPNTCWCTSLSACATWCVRHTSTFTQPAAWLVHVPQQLTGNSSACISSITLTAATLQGRESFIICVIFIFVTAPKSFMQWLSLLLLPRWCVHVLPAPQLLQLRFFTRDRCDILNRLHQCGQVEDSGPHLTRDSVSVLSGSAVGCPLPVTQCAKTNYSLVLLLCAAGHPIIQLHADLDAVPVLV